jgi:hypothetical protein
VRHRLEPAPVAGELVGPQQRQPGFGDDVELDEAMGIALAVGLALGGDADEKARPGVLGAGLAVVQQQLRLPGDVGDGGRVARVGVVVHPAGKNIGRALTEVAVHPVVAGRHSDGAGGVDAPQTAEQILGIGGDGALGVGPGIALHGLRGDAYAQVALAVLAGVPGRDGTVDILDGGMGVVARLGDPGVARVHR